MALSFNHVGMINRTTKPAQQGKSVRRSRDWAYNWREAQKGKREYKTIDVSTYMKEKA